MHNDTNSNNIIEFSHVTKAYASETIAVHDVSFNIHGGEFVCIIGASGCGKSTLLKLIAGLETFSTGTLKKPENVSMVFQSGALFPWLTVSDNIALGVRAQGMSEAIIKKTVEHHIEMMKLSDYANRYPAALSGGQRQRVGIARALAVNPMVLLLDEPFSALDPKITAELHDDLIHIWKETGKTIVMVSHLIEEAVTLSTRILLMKEGQLDATYAIELPYPRREQAVNFIQEVQKIRKDFFK